MQKISIMKYRKYIIIAFIAALLAPLFSAKAVNTNKLDSIIIENVVFEEQPEILEFEFDTEQYLPDGFNAYQNQTAVETIQFMEDDSVELGFDTATYLPANFDPFKK